MLLRIILVILAVIQDYTTAMDSVDSRFLHVWCTTDSVDITDL